MYFMNKEIEKKCQFSIISGYNSDMISHKKVAFSGTLHRPNINIFIKIFVTWGITVNSFI